MEIAVLSSSASNFVKFSFNRRCFISKLMYKKLYMDRRSQKFPILEKYYLSFSIRLSWNISLVFRGVNGIFSTLTPVLTLSFRK